MLVTDSDMVGMLIGLARIPEDQVSGVLYASGLVAHKAMTSLGGTYRPDGSWSDRYPYMAEEWRSFKPDAHPVSGDGLTGSPHVARAYSGVIAGIPEALSSIAALAKKTGANAEPAKLLVERTEAWITQRYSAWEAKPVSLEAYLEGRAIADWLKAAPNLKTQSKAIEGKLKEWVKDDTLKDELAARKAYAALGPMAFSTRKSEMDQARSALDQLAAKYDGTAYGRQAKVLRQAMDAPRE